MEYIRYSSQKSKNPLYIPIDDINYYAKRLVIQCGLMCVYNRQKLRGHVFEKKKNLVVFFLLFYFIDLFFGAVRIDYSPGEWRKNFFTTT